MMNDDVLGIYKDLNFKQILSVKRKIYVNKRHVEWLQLIKYIRCGEVRDTLFVLIKYFNIYIKINIP